MVKTLGSCVGAGFTCRLHSQDHLQHRRWRRLTPSASNGHCCDRFCIECYPASSLGLHMFCIAEGVSPATYYHRYRHQQNHFICHAPFSPSKPILRPTRHDFESSPRDDVRPHAYRDMTAVRTVGGVLPHDPDMASGLAVRLMDASLERQVIVPPVPVSPSDWLPAQGECHANALAWVRRHPDHEVVHGWLYIMGQPGSDAVFEAHSVVSDCEGLLWDVTKLHGTDHIFLVHDRDAEEFLRLSVPGGPWVQVREQSGAAVIVSLMETQGSAFRDSADSTGR